MTLEHATWTSATGTSGTLIGQKPERIQLEQVCDAFQRPQRQVAFATLESADICTVQPEQICEGFLRETELLSVRAQIAVALIGTWLFFNLVPKPGPRTLEFSADTSLA